MSQLSPKGRAELAQVLRDSFKTVEDLRELTEDNQLDTTLASITPEKAIPEMIIKIVDHFDGSDQLRELVTEAMKLRPAVEPLQVYGEMLIKQLEAAMGWYRPPSDPHETCFISSGLPFISRGRLRQFVRDISDPKGAKVFVVNGLSKMGKTYSRAFLEYVRLELRDDPLRAYVPVQIDLADDPLETPPSFDPEYLARSIAMGFSWNYDSMPKPPTTRYAKELAQWIIGQSLRSNGNWVIVLDGFHHPALHTESRELIQQLIRRITLHSSNIRLLLLNFGEELIPADVHPIIYTEVVSTLTLSDVEGFFTTLYQQKGRAPDREVIDFIAQKIIAKTKEIIAKSLPTASNYNELLSMQVKITAETLG